jgi:hypothetical protein
MHILSALLQLAMNFHRSPSTRKIQITLRILTFAHVSMRPTVFRVIVRRYDTLTVVSHVHVTTQAIGVCPLHGKILVEMVILRVSYAGPLLYKPLVRNFAMCKLK